MMKRFLIAAALAFGIAGCSTTGIIPTITNPVTNLDIYRVKNVYVATLQLAADYRTYCWSKTYQQILADPIMKPVCQNRRAVVRKIQQYQPPAGQAVRTAEAFVKNNPTLNPVNVVTSAWNAVTAFQSAVPRTN